MPLPNVSTNIGNVSMDYFLRGVDAAKAQGVQAQGQAECGRPFAIGGCGMI